MNTADLSLFVRTADTGSITASARQLDISPAAASAALKRLEKQLETELFIRSTRQLRITAEGERFLLYCRRALEALDEGKTSLRVMRGEISGRLRFSVSSDLGRNLVLPWLDEMMEDHPDLSLQLSVGDSLSDFYLDRVDIALRYGEPEDSSMVAFQITTVDRVICASPDYLEKFGKPTHPNDLKHHNCLRYRLDNQVYDEWELNNSDGTYKVKVKSNRLCNDADIVRRWAVAGKGIAFKSRLDMIADLQSGRVVELLTDYNSAPLTLWLVCPTRKQVTPTALMLRDMLREKCADLKDLMTPC
ncbi:LysR family transcriptional regulator [Motiliproteus sp. MSK22-1]|uniref:LysR family transcriptional regulator n=1 Tax=Motiliproteus sp. MSK22-1 TaxID=1897630 RepID=UPI000977BA38|nr:LysR family transcriptional regulator [Motiliproteus sp. MSK22-1]OMH30308.1 LysR family transcriptional regulator [Motiliproteus sp. MSK22-1]